MAIFRTYNNLKRDYSIFANKTLHDDRLTLASLGMMVYLAAFPEKQIPHRDAIKHRFNLSQQQYDKIIHELAEAGHAELEVQS